MDRPPVDRSRADGWQVLLVPEDPAEVRRVRLSSTSLARWRLLAGLLSLVVLASWAALAFAWPRAAAYGHVFDENVELKQRLDGIDRKMGEVDRILLRLRMYDAQLDSFAEPTGPHGPVEGDPPSPEATAELEAWPSPLEAAGGEGGEGGDEDGYRTASEWAEGVDDRLTSFLETFDRSESNLSRVVEDLEQVRALRAALPSIWPADGVITSDYGWRRSPFGNREWKHHSGVDIGGVLGNVVRATAAGRVVLAGWDMGYGKAVRIDHGFGIQTLYAHNSKLLVKVGDRVEPGQQIAVMGSTGRSTGPHCHFELSIDGHLVDPLEYLVVPAEAVAPWAPPRER